MTPLFLSALILAAAPELRITLHAATPDDLAAGPFLSSILAKAGLRTSLLPATPDNPLDRTVWPVHVPKGAERAAACAARRDIAVLFHPGSPNLPPSTLALAQPLAQRGINVVVFPARVRAAATRSGTPYPTLLAHVLAHEIGHVLLRHNRHALTGIMSTGWGYPEFARMRQGALTFLNSQARDLRLALTGADCTASASIRHTLVLPNSGSANLDLAHNCLNPELLSR